jgi:DNA ligase D-like protein (predicted 3'-phosphoesterase)
LPAGGSPVHCPPARQADRLHFDLRLQLRGVLKSWTLPREPALAPGERRLAIHVEDHPREWLNFRGAVPERYGGGKVEVWDTGCWYADDPDGDVKDAYDKGRLEHLSQRRANAGQLHPCALSRARERGHLAAHPGARAGRRSAGRWRGEGDDAPAVSGSDTPLAQVREILARANVAVDPAGIRVVGRFGECLADASTRDRARKALRDAGIHASLVRGRLLFPLRQS